MKYKYCYSCGSEVEVVDDNGIKRAYCPRCKMFLYENPLPTVVALAFRNDNEILLVKRNVDPGMGEWSLPGGFMEIGETPQQAIKREMFEETGLNVIESSLLNIASHLNGYYGDVLIIGFLVVADNNDLQPGDDVSEAKFFTISERPRLVFHVHESFVRKWEKNRN